MVTVMPVVAHDLGGLDLYGWVFSAFMLGSVVGIVVAGRETDRRGPALPFVAGLVLFGSGLVVAGLAPSMPVLVGGRVLQGLGAGAVPSVAYVAIGRSLPDRLRPRMMAVLSTAWVAGEHRVVDALGAAAGAAMLLAGLTELSGSGASPEIGVALVAFGFSLSAVVLRRLLPQGTWRARPGLPATVLSRGVLTFTFFGADAYVTLTITTVRHHGPGLAGVAVTGATLGWTAGAWVQARMSERLAGGLLVRTGLAVVLAGIAGMALILMPGVPVAVGIVAWTAAGLGMGLAYAPLSLMMLREAPPGREGWASASLNLADVLGTAIGIGIGGAALAAAVRSGREVAMGVLIAFAFAAAAAVVGLVISRRLPVGRLTAGRGGADEAEGPHGHAGDAAAPRRLG